MPTVPATQPLHIARIDASMLARICQEQVSALAALAGMCRPDATLTNDEWMSLLDPIAEQLRVLREMLDHGLDTAESHLVRVDCQ
jgi:hypothetical protein